MSHHLSFQLLLQYFPLLSPLFLQKNNQHPSLSLYQGKISLSQSLNQVPQANVYPHKMMTVFPKAWPQVPCTLWGCVLSHWGHVQNFPLLCGLSQPSLINETTYQTRVVLWNRLNLRMGRKEKEKQEQEPRMQVQMMIGNKNYCRHLKRSVKLRIWWMTTTTTTMI